MTESVRKKEIRLHFDVFKETFRAVPKVGDKMPDGTIYAGVSPDSGKSMYSTPADDSLRMTFNEAKEYAANLDAHGHNDWHLPTKSELNVLFNGQAVIGGFDLTQWPGGHHWSSSQNANGVAWGQSFIGGFQNGCCKDADFHVRFVRLGALD